MPKEDGDGDRDAVSAMRGVTPVDEVQLRRTAAMLPPPQRLDDAAQLELVDGNHDSLNLACFEAGKGLRLPHLAVARQWARVNSADWVSVAAQG